MLIFSIILVIVIVYIVLKINFVSVVPSENNKGIHPNSFFSKIYVICLPERKEHMKKKMKDLGLNAIFVDAILKKNLNKVDLVNDGTISQYCKDNKSTGKIACHLSHLKVINKFLDEDNGESCLIFEDDLSIPFDEVDTINRMKDVIKDLPLNWEIVYFGRCWDKKCSQQQQVGKYLYGNVQPLCRHAYALSREGAKKISELCLPMDKLNGDQMYLKLITENKLTAFAVHPQLFAQNRENFGSNLENYDNLTECSKKRLVNLKKVKEEINFSPRNYFQKKNPFNFC